VNVLQQAFTGPIAKGFDFRRSSDCRWTRRFLTPRRGDKEFWIINRAHTLCYLHPAQQGIRSNLNVITSAGHVYSILLTEISNEPNAEPDLKVFVERKEESTIAANSGVPPLARASEVQAYKTAVDAARIVSGGYLKIAVTSLSLVVFGLVLMNLKIVRTVENFKPMAERVSFPCPKLKWSPVLLII
jgi:hypothetical protein